MEALTVLTIALAVGVYVRAWGFVREVTRKRS